MSWGVSWILLSITWGLSFLFMKVGLHSFEPIQIAFLRIAFGAIAMFLVLIFTRQKLSRDKRLWFHSLVVGIFLCSIPYTLICTAETRISSALASIFNACMPFFTVLIAPLMVKSDRPTPKRIVGLIISFLGVLTVFGVWNGNLTGDLFGSLLVITATLCYAFGSGYTKKYLTGKVGIVEQSTMQLIAGSAVMIPFIFLTPWRTQDLAIRPVLSVLVLGVVGTGVAYLWMNIIYRDAGPTIGSTVTYALPLVATTAGILGLHEKVTLNEIVGALIILSGLSLTQNWRIKRSA